MKISLTFKNNLKHFSLLVIFAAILILIAVTNSRYESSTSLTAQAIFPTTVIEITQIGNVSSYEIEAGESLKLQYSITNRNGEKINNNNIQYYLNLVDANGSNIQSVSLKVRETPAVDDDATYDIATSLSYVSGKGYGPIQIKNDGTVETKNFDVFIKAGNVSSNISLNAKMKAYAESITNNQYNIAKTANLQLSINAIEVQQNNNSDTNMFVYLTTASTAKIIGLSETGENSIDTISKLEIPEEYNDLPVTEINVGTSLQNKTNLTEIVIPATVTTLAKTTFYGCSNVTSLTCPLSLDMSDIFNSTTNKIEEIVFTANDTNKNGFNYNSTSYKKTPWYYSKDLAEQNELEQEELKELTISFSRKIISIGNYTFKDLIRFETTIASSLNFDNTLTKIGDYAFYNTNVTGSIDVGETGLTKELGENAFNDGVIINILDPEQD